MKWKEGVILTARKRVTQIFPFLLPLRKWQRKKFFYAKMRLDGRRYAGKKSEKTFPALVFETSIPMINTNSGFAMKYQFNKVHNLRLAAGTIDGIVLEPGETFSFWQLVRRADRCQKYKEGLHVIDGKTIPAYGGGLCMLSDLLFWMFLHTPLTIVERHGHAALSFPSTTETLPQGVDATVNEGWLDLKVCNETDHAFQITLWFDENRIYGRIGAQNALHIEYSVFNSSVSYRRQGGKVYQTASVCRVETDRNSGRRIERELYSNRCQIAYRLPDTIMIEEEEDKR